MTADTDLRDWDQITRILEQSDTIAVIGMKPSGAALAIPRYMESEGYNIVPVNPNYDEVGGHPTYPSVDAVPEPVDIVNIFRRSPAVSDHIDQILAMEPPPKLVWLQLGIRNESAAQRLADAGIPVVQDKCLKVEHRRLFG